VTLIFKKFKLCFLHRRLLPNQLFRWTIAAKCGLSAVISIFIDNSLLHFRELFIGQSKLQKKTTTYHTQREDGTLVFRTRHAPHYPDLPSAPHHKHLGEGDAVAADAPDLFIVLKEIENLLQR
jgi:hypothetical protein